MNTMRINALGLIEEYLIDPNVLKNDALFISNANNFDLSGAEGYVGRMGRILRWLRSTLNAESGTLYILEGNVLRLVYVQNELLNHDGVVLNDAGRSAYERNTDMIDKRTIYGFSMVSGKCVKIDSFASIPYKMPFFISPLYDDWYAHKKVSLLTVPLITDGGKPLAAVQLLNRKIEPQAFGPFSESDPARILTFFKLNQLPIVDTIRLCLADITKTRLASPVAFNSSSAEPDEKPQKSLPWLDGSGVSWTELERGKESAISHRLLLFTDYVYCLNSLNSVMDVILTEAMDATSSDAGAFLIVEKNEQIRLACLHNKTHGRLLFAYADKNSKRLFAKEDSIAAYAARMRKAVNVTDAWNLPVEAPYRFDRSLDNATNYRTTSILAMPITAPDGRVLAVLYLNNATDPEGRVRAFDTAAESYTRYLATHVMPHLLRALEARSMIDRMLFVLGLQNTYEGVTHAARIATLSSVIFKSWAESRKMSEPTISARLDLLWSAAMMHDIGMAYVPVERINKNALLSKKDREIVNRHPAMGAAIFADAETGAEQIAHDVILHHHQRWDGTGYTGSDAHPPLAGEEIPLFARVVAVADAFDALTTPRSYKNVLSFANAMGFLRMGAGSHFDPSLVDAAFSAEDVLHSLYRKHLFETKLPDQKLSAEIERELGKAEQQIIWIA